MCKRDTNGLTVTCKDDGWRMEYFIYYCASKNRWELFDNVHGTSLGGIKRGFARVIELSLLFDNLKRIQYPTVESGIIGYRYASVVLSPRRSWLATSQTHTTKKYTHQNLSSRRSFSYLEAISNLDMYVFRWLGSSENITNQVFLQSVGIPKGTNCSCFLKVPSSAINLSGLNSSGFSQ